MKEIKNPVGRPRTNVKDLPENWKQIVMDCGQEGGSAVEMRCLLGIAQTAWATLVEHSEEFRLTISASMDLCEVWWERTGRNMATGSPGNASVWSLNMRNRFGWNEKQQIDHTTKGESIREARELTDVELEAIIAQRSGSKSVN